MKRILSLLIFMILVLPASSAAETVNFTDINESHWAYRDVANMALEGVVDGYPDGSFRPEEKITYGEFIKMALAAGKVNVLPHDGSSSGHWAKPYYDAGLNMLYYSAYDIKEAALDRLIPRGHMAIIAGSMMGDIKISDYGDYDDIMENIRDVNSRTLYEYEIVKSYATGVLAGYPDRTFRPAEPLTRGEAAAVAARLMNRLGTLAEESPENTGAVSDSDKPSLDEPLVKVGSVMSTEPEGTLTLTVENYGTDITEQKAELLSILKRERPVEAEELYRSFCDFADKDYGKAQQGIRKQYVGDHPILIERLLTTVRIFIFPPGWTNRFFETEPGEIYESFF